MNGPVETIRQKFNAALKAQAFNCEGVVASHDENLTDMGITQVWNALKIADLEVNVRE